MKKFLLIGLLLSIAVVALCAVSVFPRIAASHLAAGERLRLTDVESDRSQAAAEYESAATYYRLSVGSGSLGGCLFWRAWLLEPHHNSVDGDWDLALDLFEASLTVYESEGGELGQARALYYMAHVLEPGNHPDGTWSDALTLHQQAISAFAKCHEPEVLAGAFDADLYVRSLYQAAYALMPNNNETGDWDRAAGFYARAAQMSRKASFAAFEAQSTHQQAYCIKPENNPNGSWVRAATFFAEAARLRNAIGDISGTALSLHEQAECLVKGRPENMTDVARNLFLRAAALHRSIADEKSAAASESWIK